jgi:predicted membrane-bound spermidine synthase
MDTLDVTVPQRTPQAQTRPWRPSLVVFVSSACIMVLELVAGRIIAPYVGASLYTWTSVIGVILAGMSLGNYLGGRFADRWASPRFLGSTLVVASLLSLGVIALDRLGVLASVGGPLIVQIVVVIAVLFFLPATVLGTISPMVAKLALRDLDSTGRTVGRIYAAGSVGSIVGTFATGFLLIAWLSTHAILLVVSLVLLVLGLVFLVMRR